MIPWSYTFDFSVSFLAGISLVMLFALLVVRPKIGIILFLFSLMFTEFYWIDFFGGYLKPFHIMAVVVFLTFSLYRMKPLGKSKIVVLFLFFVGFCMISIALSDDWKNALRSFMLPLMLMSIGLNIALALHYKKITEEFLLKTIAGGTIFLIVIALLQEMSRRTGVSLAFTPIQEQQITLAHRPPSLFTEADTFGKYLLLPFSLAIPYLTRTHEFIKRRYVVIFVGLVLAAIAINFTRSAIISLLITIAIYILYLLRLQRLKKGFGLIVVLLCLGILLVPVVVSFARSFTSVQELHYRINTLMNPLQSSTSDGSIRYRKEALELTFKASFESLEAFCFGHGWGSTLQTSFGTTIDGGANIFVNILFFSGFFPLALFLMICGRILFLSYKLSIGKVKHIAPAFAEGILVAFWALLIASQLASMWTTAEFWLIIGCGVYLELAAKRQNESPAYP